METAPEDMENTNDAKVAELICMEPLLYKGLTASELVTVAISSFLFWALLSVATLIINAAGLFIIFAAFPVALLLAILTVLIAASILRKLKRNRPDGYYEQLMIIYLKKLGVLNSHIIVRDIKWDI